MKSYKRSHFAPNNVESRIKRVLEMNPENPIADPDEQFIQRLHRYHQPQNEYDLAVKRVKQRLEQHQMTRADEHTVPQQSPNRQETHPSPPKRHLRHPLSWLAAAALSILLVGSMITLLNQISARTSHPNQPPQLVQGKAQNIIVSVSATSKIFSGNITILANRASDGGKIWSYVTKQQFAMHAAITVQAQVVYAKVNDQIYALQAADGKLLWHLSLPWISSTPPDFSHDTGDLVVDHGLVFTTLAESNTGTSILFALNANDGKVLWQYQTGGEELFTVASGKVYAAVYLNHTYRLVALQETTGHFLWSYHKAVSFIAQQDNRVYIVSIVWNIPQGGTPLDAKSESTLLALNTENGNVLWSNKIATTFVESTNVGHMIVEKNKLLFFNGSHFCAYQTSNGYKLWCSQHDPNNAGSMIPFVLINNTIYATYFLGGQGGMQLEALDSTNGTVLWSKNVSDPQSLMHGLIAIMDDKIYLIVSRLSGAENLSALSLNDGHPLWQYDFPFMTLTAAAGSQG